MTLAQLIARVAQAGKRIQHFSATATLADRRIKRWRKAYLAAVTTGGVTNEVAKQKARKRIIYWKARKYKAEDLRRNWKTLLARRRAQKKRYQHNHPPVDADGFATWHNPNGLDVLVAPWMVGIERGPDGKKVNWLLLAMQHGWSGNLTSGVRTAAHSVELCLEICGARSCPGRCAGETSNHNCDRGCPSPEGAIDAEDYFKLKAIFEEIGAPLQNQLPDDPVHFSYTGH